ncbi:hypothetical protein BS78_04G196000 [Paspalum vaginatum]|nr:hypothetical protein BS78_04G196000 [Paspalum vaginatum]
MLGFSLGYSSCATVSSWRASWLLLLRCLHGGLVDGGVLAGDAASRICGVLLLFFKVGDKGSAVGVASFPCFLGDGVGSPLFLLRSARGKIIGTFGVLVFRAAGVVGGGGLLFRSPALRAAAADLSGVLLVLQLGQWCFQGQMRGGVMDLAPLLVGLQDGAPSFSIWFFGDGAAASFPWGAAPADLR